ncbi:MAG: hypothetical protein COW65_10695 [Cytophagales bacterium CG18_big_fil_WC_8_21_14_2_50_42_9]|nr:MAG: hypothetical protein COW65_10695 [Cytophagales bacterium CG18_big_fil_WC_8_21_14_2_50_42_9]
MITLHVFTEEPSAKNVFEIILPKILPEGVLFSIYPHQGKQDLERALRTTVPSISKIPGSRILITRDQDSADCKELKLKLTELVKDTCKSPYLIRILCRELESWFLGDLNAINQAYPRMKPESYASKAEFRNVDNMQSPNRYLLKILPDYEGRDNLPKLEVSENIAPFLDLENNTSSSFRYTIQGIKKLIHS